MRILVEQSSYHLRNMGDIAMLQAAITRLYKLWPDALIEVMTDAPDLLKIYCPQAQPIAADGHRIWLKDGMLFRSVYKFLPNQVSQYLLRIDKKIWNSWPLLLQTWVQTKKNFHQNGIDKNVRAYLEAIFRADLVVATGGGYLTDIFPWQMRMVLDTLKMASQLGKPTAMVGQGIGPLYNPKLRAKAQAVLPCIGVMGLRESRVGLPYLDSLGVDLTRIITTGDDAIELAYKARPTGLGTKIGVNLRLAKYSEVKSDTVEIVRSLLLDVAKKYHAPLTPLPISFHDLDSDVKAIEQLLVKSNTTANGWQTFNDPLQVIQETGHCRVVVTGSYHAAVFALAQGIPVVALARSTYYIDKFLGLVDQFGAGCHVVFFNDKAFPEKFVTQVDQAWQSAEQVRPQLLQAAVQQIESGHMAYRRLYELVTSQKVTA